MTLFCVQELSVELYSTLCGKINCWITNRLTSNDSHIYYYSFSAKWTIEQKAGHVIFVFIGIRYDNICLLYNAMTGEMCVVCVSF